MSATAPAAGYPTLSYLPPPPPGYAFPYRVAGLIQRFVAVLIDTLVLVVAAIAIAAPLGVWAAVARLALGPPAGYLAFLFLPFLFLALGLWILYFTLFEGSTGQTPGKRVLGLQVIDLKTGAPPKPGQALVRTLLRIVDWLPAMYVLGFIVAMLTQLKQRLGDVIANTAVIQVEPHAA